MSNEKYSRPGTSGLIFEEPPIFEISSPGRQGADIPVPDTPVEPLESLFNEEEIRDEIEDFPEVSEFDVVRHFTRLSQWNFAIDLGFYPLGSCTMKYNPRVNEMTASLPFFRGAHPMQPEEYSQACLKVMYELEEALKEICGFNAVSLQPSAGAHGELTGLLLIRAYLNDHGAADKDIVLIPNSAHGTNPASSVTGGFKTVEVDTRSDGCMDVEDLKSKLNDKIAAIMVTNPNTLGIFEKDICEVSGMIHDAGGLVYCDGANMNAMLGIARPGDMGIDVIHVNLHKTFSTPHGGGGPGAGPVAVNEKLEPYLPMPGILKENDKFRLNWDIPKSIGKVSTFYGNFAVMVRALTYIKSLGKDGLKRISEMAVLNANYVRKSLEQEYNIPYNVLCKHEVIMNDKKQSKFGVSTMDIAKRLLDYGFHPPTVYFPLIVPGALMIEPTENESKKTIDAFIQALKDISAEAQKNPDALHSAPHLTKRTRLDETKAARNPVLKMQKEDNS